jgi:hypothetical protein
MATHSEKVKVVVAMVNDGVLMVLGLLAAVATMVGGVGGGGG